MHEPDPILASLSDRELPPENVSLALLARAKHGDDLALHDLLARYQDRLRRIVRIQLGHSALRREHDSLDLVQDTFLAALPRIRELEPRSAASLLNWLAMIATNQIRDRHDHMLAQKRDARRTVPLGGDSTHGAGIVAGTEPGPAMAAELGEIRELLDAAVAELPDDQRRVVLLHDYCGESWEQIAVELHRENGAARQLHQRAWIKLRSKLRPAVDRQRRADQHGKERP